MKCSLRGDDRVLLDQREFKFVQRKESSNCIILQP